MFQSDSRHDPRQESLDVVADDFASRQANHKARLTPCASDEPGAYVSFEEALYRWGWSL